MQAPATPGKTSLIVSSYNQPNALALVLEGILLQMPDIDEVVFGDDGSEPDTKALVDAFVPRCPVPVLWTAQPDKGFRKAKALNNAIRASSGARLLFLDGDCIPLPGWAKRHLAALAAGWDFVTAGYIWLDLARAKQLTVADVAALLHLGVATAEELAALASVQRKEWLYRLLRFRRKPRILGGNWAVTRAALLAVNGIDENYDQFSKEDSDVRNRLRNAGFRGVAAWAQNYVLHCDHGLDPRRNLPQVVRQVGPDVLYYRTRLGSTWCDAGLLPQRAAKNMP